MSSGLEAGLLCGQGCLIPKGTQPFWEGSAKGSHHCVWGLPLLMRVFFVVVS